MVAVFKKVKRLVALKHALEEKLAKESAEIAAEIEEIIMGLPEDERETAKKMLDKLSKKG